jgi:hypothetical protein
MSWVLPVPLLVLAALMRRPTSAPRLVLEAFAVALLLVAAVWAPWVLFWLLKQR